MTVDNLNFRQANIAQARSKLPKSQIPDHASSRNITRNSSGNLSMTSPPSNKQPNQIIKSNIYFDPTESLESLRQKVHNSKTPLHQFEFAKHLIYLAEEMKRNPEDLPPHKVKTSRDTLHAEALKWIKKASRSSFFSKGGLSEALFFLGDCYGTGKLGLPINSTLAFEHYEQAARQGHAPSMYRTGVCYEVGAGPKRNQERAMQYFKKAASLGETASMYKIGMALLKGTMGQMKNQIEGVNYLQLAADSSDETAPYAMYELAILYEGVDLDPSTGILPDPKHALDLYLQSANLGHAPAQFKLGMAFEFGHMNLKPDARVSISWYSKSAVQGDPYSELALSGWYLTGSENILEKNDMQAFLWAQKAADKGLAKAEYTLAYFYEKGIGTTPDLQKALRWYIKSAEHGHLEAKERLKK